MKNIFLYILLITVVFSCSKSNEANNDCNGCESEVAQGCEGFFYPNWQTSKYILPYSVGEAYTIGLSHCSGFPHSEGLPDQFAIVFIMDIGTLLVASRK